MVIKRISKYSLSDDPNRLSMLCLQSIGCRPLLLQEPTDDRSKDGPFAKRRCIMKKLIAALALVTLIAIPTLALPASAANVSPSSSSFGDNGY